MCRMCAKKFHLKSYMYGSTPKMTRLLRKSGPNGKGLFLRNTEENLLILIS
jgi:hypothetical protein